LHIKRAMLGNTYAAAFENGYGATCRFLISRGAPRDEAEEIAQAAWVRGWEFREQLRDPGLVSYWVNSIARNLFRARFRRVAPVSLESAKEPAYVFDTDAIDVRTALGRCSHRDRELFERAMQGYSADEIARDSGVSSTGIRVRLLRARRSMRRAMTAGASIA
jgi:RNA polymerase sigma factor (sigma-70 family)